jgi:hypothetical protein
LSLRLQFFAVVTAATCLSACEGSSQIPVPREDFRPAAAGAIADVHACFQQEDYLVRLDSDGMGMTASGKRDETARINVLTNSGGAFLSATLDADSASVLHRSSFRDTVHECLAPYKAPPPLTFGSPP